MQRKPDAYSQVLVPEVVVRSRSSSPLRKAIESDPALRLAWDNEVAFHVSRNLLLLRKFREESQADVAATAGTSQGKIARIESGLENITLKTLKKLIVTLGGRFMVSISPKEVTIPFCPDWWDWLSVDGGAGHWVFQRAALIDDGLTKTAAIAWTASTDMPTFPSPSEDGTISLTLTDGDMCDAPEPTATT